jgi:hypothetical protein
MVALKSCIARQQLSDRVSLEVEADLKGDLWRCIDGSDGRRWGGGQVEAEQ